MHVTPPHPTVHNDNLNERDKLAVDLPREKRKKVGVGFA